MVVLGLARGIVGAAHQAALDGGTIAVIASGIDIAYPPEHADLQEAIASKGLLLAEQPPAPIRWRGTSLRGTGSSRVLLRAHWSWKPRPSQAR